MKHLRLALAALVLALAGCAAVAPPGGPMTAPDQGMAAAPADASPRTGSAGAQAAAPVPLTPVYPGGPLQPIAAAEAARRAVASTQPPADLWERIRRGYAMPNLDTDHVRVHEQWYATRPEYIQRMTERSRKYLFHIVEEIERRGMPSELALLPFIESAFNPQAVSTARAAGMWQFIPSTGKDFALKQNVFRDDRRDVLASTRAALDYLQKLYGMFGDWHLALAAYNWGEGSVSRAQARNQRAGQGLAYTDLNMPAETRNYVPKLQAVKNLVGAPERFRVSLPVIDNHPYFQTVTVDRDIDVELAARLAEVRMEDFQALNPSHQRPVILAAGNPTILLPWDNAEVFQRNYEQFNAGPFASWTAWSVPATMSVAEVARRVGMQEGQLRSINTIPPRMLVKAGSVLIIPRSARMQDDVASHVADNGQLSLAPEQVLRRTTVKAGKKESVASIARRYHVSPGQVAEWNNVSQAAVFSVGQNVVLNLPVKAAAPRKAGGTPRGNKPAKPAPKRVTRPVKR